MAASGSECSPAAINVTKHRCGKGSLPEGYIFLKVHQRYAELLPAAVMLEGPITRLTRPNGWEPQVLACVCLFQNKVKVESHANLVARLVSASPEMILLIWNSPPAL